MKCILYILVLLTLASCNYHYENRKIQAVVIDKEYIAPYSTIISVPYICGKFTGVRLQKVNHPEKYIFTIQYIDANYSNHGNVEKHDIDCELYNSTELGDTILVNLKIQTND